MPDGGQRGHIQARQPGMAGGHPRLQLSGTCDGKTAGGRPGGQREHVRALHLGAPQQDLGQDLPLQQQHRLAPLAHIAKLLDGVRHVLVPPAVMAQRAMPAQSSHVSGVQLSHAPEADQMTPERAGSVQQGQMAFPSPLTCRHPRLARKSRL